MSTTKTPRFAALYKNLAPSVLATSAYSLRKQALIKAAEKAATKAAEAAIAPRLIDIMSMKAHEAACKNMNNMNIQSVQAPAYYTEYDDDDDYDYELDEIIDHIYDYDW